MTRNLKIAIAGGLILVLGAAGAVAGYFQYQAYKLRKVHADAERYYADGDWKRARFYFRRYVALERSDIDALTKYAAASERVLTNRPVVLQDVARAYMQLYDLDRANHGALEKCIDAYVRSRDWNNLEYKMSQLMSERPDDLELLYYRALSLDRLGRWEEAKVHYEKLVEADVVDYPEAYRNLATLYQERGDAAGALALFGTVVEKHPDKASIWSEGGLFFIDLKKQDQAREYLANAENIDPNAPDVIYLAARYALARKDYEDGLDQLALLLAVEPNRPRGYLASLIAYQESGQFDKAIEFVNGMAPDLLADQPELCMARVELCVTANRLDDARTHLDVYKTWYPEHTVPQEYLDARIMLS
ncbi:MAG: tetratricopeptide repeat protein, partial [Candidatus Hydrogenedentota bacterium]